MDEGGIERFNFRRYIQTTLFSLGNGDDLLPSQFVIAFRRWSAEQFLFAAILAQAVDDWQKLWQQQYPLGLTRLFYLSEGLALGTWFFDDAPDTQSLAVVCEQLGADSAGLGVNFIRKWALKVSGPRPLDRMTTFLMRAATKKHGPPRYFTSDERRVIVTYIATLGIKQA